MTLALENAVFQLATNDDTANKGMETRALAATPGAMTPVSNVLCTLMIYLFVFGAQVPLVAPILFSDAPTFQAAMTPAFEQVGMPALNFHSFATAVGFVSFLQLVATFQFEKKITQWQGFVGFALLFVGFNCDAIVATYKTVCLPQVLPIMELSNNYLPDMLAQNHLSEATAGLTASVIATGNRKAVEKSVPKDKPDFDFARKMQDVILQALTIL